LWVIFALLDPDPDSESGSGSIDQLKPDPQPWTQARRATRHQARFLKRSGETVAACAALLARLEAEILAEAELITSVRFLFGATPHNPKVRDSVVHLHHFDADQYSTYQPSADPDQDPIFKKWLKPLKKVLK
jgi:hypothetical protein